MKILIILATGANETKTNAYLYDGKKESVLTQLELEGELEEQTKKYSKLKKYQYHGSIYGVAPAKRGFLKPVGQWNRQEVIVRDSRVRVILNGETIVDANVAETSKNGTPDGKKHPGLKRTEGHIALLGHGSVILFRNIRLKEFVQ